MDTPKSNKELANKAPFEEVLKKHLSEMKTVKLKRCLHKVVSVKVINKYKLWRMNDAGMLEF